MRTCLTLHPKVFYVLGDRHFSGFVFKFGYVGVVKYYRKRKRVV